MGNNGQRWTTIRGATCISDAVFYAMMFFSVFKVFFPIPITIIDPVFPTMGALSSTRVEA